MVIDWEWQWVGTPLSNKSTSKRSYYNKVRRVDPNHTYATRVFSVGDTVCMRGDEEQIWIAHLLELFEVHAGDALYREAKANQQAQRDRQKQSPNQLIPVSKFPFLRCTIRWFYGRSDVADDIFERCTDLPTPITDEVYFSDYVERDGFNEVEVLEGKAWLFTTRHLLKQFEIRQPPMFEPSFDALRVARCFIDNNHDAYIKHHKSNSSTMPPVRRRPARKLLKGELDHLVANPSKSTNLFESSYNLFNPANKKKATMTSPRTSSAKKKRRSSSGVAVSSPSSSKKRTSAKKRTSTTAESDADAGDDDDDDGDDSDDDGMAGAKHIQSDHDDGSGGDGTNKDDDDDDENRTVNDRSDGTPSASPSVRRRRRRPRPRRASTQAHLHPPEGLDDAVYNQSDDDDDDFIESLKAKHKERKKPKPRMRVINDDDDDSNSDSDRERACRRQHHSMGMNMVAADDEDELSPVPNSAARRNPAAQSRHTPLSQLQMRTKAKTGRSINNNKTNTNTAKARIEKDEEDALTKQQQQQQQQQHQQRRKKVSRVATDSQSSYYWTSSTDSSSESSESSESSDDSDEDDMVLRTDERGNVVAVPREPSSQHHHPHAEHKRYTNTGRRIVRFNREEREDGSDFEGNDGKESRQHHRRQLSSALAKHRGTKAAAGTGETQRFTKSRRKQTATRRRIHERLQGNNQTVQLHAPVSGPTLHSSANGVTGASAAKRVNPNETFEEARNEVLSFIDELNNDVDKQPPQKTGSSNNKARTMMMKKSPLENPVFGAASTIDPVDDNTAVAVVPVDDDDEYGDAVENNNVPRSHGGPEQKRVRHGRDGDDLAAASNAGAKNRRRKTLGNHTTSVGGKSERRDRKTSAKQIDMITIIEDDDEDDNNFSAVPDNDNGSSSSPMGVGVRNDTWHVGSNGTVAAAHKRHHGRGSTSARNSAVSGAERRKKIGRRAVSTPSPSIDIDNDEDEGDDGDKHAAAGESNNRDVDMDDNSNSDTGKYHRLVNNASRRRRLGSKAAGRTKSLGDRKMKMRDGTDDDDDEHKNENDDDDFHVQLATPSTAPARNNLSEQVRKSVLAQQQQHANDNGRGTSNRRGRDGTTTTAINDEDEDENDAAAVDTLQQQRRVKPKKGFLPSERETKVGLLRRERLEAQRRKQLQMQRVAEKQQQQQEQLLYEQQMQMQQQELEHMEQHNAPQVMIIEDGHLVITHSAPAPVPGSGSGSGSVPSSLPSSNEFQPPPDSVDAAIPVAAHPRSKEEAVMVTHEQPAQRQQQAQFHPLHEVDQVHVCVEAMKQAFNLLSLAQRKRFVACAADIVDLCTRRVDAEMRRSGGGGGHLHNHGVTAVAGGVAAGALTLSADAEEDVMFELLDRLKH